MRSLQSAAVLFMILLVMGLVLTFGVALFLWFMIMATIISVCVILRTTWYRWRGGANAYGQTYEAPFEASRNTVQVIEASYTDVTPDSDTHRDRKE